MLKKLTLLATILVMTTGLAQATPKGGVELTSAEMDTVSAGYHYYHHYTSSYAASGASAVAIGAHTAAATGTMTLAIPGLSESVAVSSASSSTYY
jgi:hypothetical protein